MKLGFSPGYPDSMLLCMATLFTLDKVAALLG